MLGLKPFFHYHENFNPIFSPSPPLLDYLMGFNIAKQNCFRNGILCPKSEVFFLPFFVICERQKYEAGGGNESVMRLFFPSVPLEKTDEPELANKVKTIK